MSVFVVIIVRKRRKIPKTMNDDDCRVGESRRIDNHVELNRTERGDVTISTRRACIAGS